VQGVHCDISICAYILIRFTPSSFCLIPLLTSQNNFNKFQISILIHEYKIQLPYLPSFTLPIYQRPLPLLPTSRQDLFYLPILHFFKVYIDCSRGFHLGISNTYILCFDEIPPLLTFSLPPFCPIIHCVHCVILFSNTDALCVSITHSFSFPLSLPVISLDRPTNIIMFSLCV
jgi:hypothetical protein